MCCLPPYALLPWQGARLRPLNGGADMLADGWDW